MKIKTFGNMDIKEIEKIINKLEREIEECCEITYSVSDGKYNYNVAKEMIL